MRHYIIDYVRQKVDHFNYQALELHYLPFPQLTLSRLNVEKDQFVRVKTETIKLRPKILPLFWGQVQFTRIFLDGLQVNLQLPGQNDRINASKEKDGYSQGIDFLSQQLLAGITYLGDSRVQMKHATINLIKENDHTLLKVENISALLVSAVPWLKIEITGQSDLIQQISFKGRLDSATLTGKGQLFLDQIDLLKLSDRFLADGKIKIGQSQLNVALDMSLRKGSHNNGRVSGDFEIHCDRLPLLYTRKGQEIIRREINAPQVNGTFSWQAGNAAIDLKQFSFDYPRLLVSGKCRWDYLTPQVVLNLQAADLDVQAIRDLALAFFGDHPDVFDVFDILRGGTIPTLHFMAREGRLQDISSEKIHLSGQLAEGMIHIADPLLDLTHVNGSVVIQNGILTGQNVTARREDAYGQNGNIQVSISNKEAPFYLDLDIETSLGALPDFLIPIVDDDDFEAEMCRIDEIDGQAKGRLTIAEKDANLITSVAVKDMQVYAKYNRLPYALEIDRGKLVYENDQIALKNVQGTLGASTFTDAFFSVDWKDETNLAIQSLKADLVLEEMAPWLESISSGGDHANGVTFAGGRLMIDSLDFNGPAAQSSSWKYALAGQVHDIRLNYLNFEPIVHLKSGQFKVTPQTFELDQIEAQALDANLSVSFCSDNYNQAGEQNKAVLSGSLGADAIAWLENKLALPAEMALRAPVTLNQLETDWGGESPDIHISSDMRINNGPEASLVLVTSPNRFQIEHLQIKDETSDAVIGINFDHHLKEISYAGTLAGETVNHLLQSNQYLKGSLQGSLNTKIDTSQTDKLVAQGELSGRDLIIPFHEKPIAIESLKANADGRRINIEFLKALWLKQEYQISGEYDAAARDYQLNVNLSTSGIDWDALKKELVIESNDKETATVDWRPFSINTKINLKSDFLESGDYVFTPFYCDISFLEQETDIDLLHVNLCGLDLPGRLQIRPRQEIIHLKPAVKNQPLDAALSCLWQKAGLASGKFDLSGELVSDRTDLVSPALQGKLTFKARKGRIYRFGLLAKIISFLNVIEVFKTKIPDWTKDGFAYDTITASGNIVNGRLKLKEATMKSPSMDIVCQGEIDLVHNEMDLLFLVAPLKTVDLLVKFTPLVNDIFKGSLVTIPIKAQGSLADPKIKPLPSKEIKKELMDIMNRSLRLPGKIIQPWLEKDKEKPSAD